MAFDTLIKHGTIIDGTGKLRYDADLGITGGRIAAISKLEKVEAGQVIDASGLVVSPGFIDMHSHSDVTLLDDPCGDSKAHQGVTTEVSGNCGYSPFPIGKAGSEGATDPDMASRYPWVWSDLDGWAKTMESKGIGLNVAPQVGHSAVRAAVGLREDRRPTEDEIKEINLVGFDVFYDFSIDGTEEIIITQQPEHGTLGDISLNVETRSEIYPQIGDIYQGGYVFQINEDGTGLVADLQDLGGMNWNDAMEAAPNATSQGYDDWYLPNIEELELMY